MFTFQNCAPMAGFETLNSAETADFSSLLSKDDYVESSYIEEGSRAQLSVQSLGKTTNLNLLRTMAQGLNNSISYGLVDLGSASYGGLTLKSCDSNAKTGTDNKAFLEKALAAAESKYVTFLFPAGTYCFSRLEIADTKGVTFQGMGSATGGTVLRLLKGQTSLFQVRAKNEKNAAVFLSFADFKITMVDPKSTVVAFDIQGTVTGLSLRRIAATNIGRFARLYGKMLNLAFENIDIKGARAPVFFFDGPYRYDEAGKKTKDKWGPQPVSFFSVKGSGMVGPGAWIRFAGAASINLHNLEFTGGTNAIHSMKGTDTNPRYVTGQDLRLKSQTGPALKFENGLGVQLDGVQIEGCRDYGVYVGGVFQRGSQFSDFQIKGCSKYGFRLNNVDFVSIINPKIELNKGKAAVRLEGQVRESILHGGQLSGATKDVERACKTKNCPSFIAKSMGFSTASWKRGMYAYTPALVDIQDRTQMIMQSSSWKALNGASDVQLQNAINELCPVGGTILIGRAGVTLSSQVSIPTSCKPIEIRGSSREDQSKIKIASSEGGLVVSGKGHNLRMLNFTGQEELQIERPLTIVDAQDILLDSNTFKNFAKGLRVERSHTLYFNYNRYSNIRGLGSVILNAPQSNGVSKVKMLLDTSKCVYSSEVNSEGAAVGAITDSGCANSTAFVIRGAVSDLVSIQSAYITGGTSIDIAASNSLKPGPLRFFQMGSDNPLNHSLKASDVSVLQIDGAWLGQAKHAMYFSGGAPEDKITIRLICAQGLENTLNAQNSKATISNLGGWYRISEPKLGPHTRLISALFEPRSWVATGSKSALFVEQNNTAEDYDDSFVLSAEERLQLLRTSYLATLGIAPSSTHITQMQDIIDNGLETEDFAAALQEASQMASSEFIALRQRNPTQQELATAAMDWLFNTQSLDDSIAQMVRSCSFGDKTLNHGSSVTAFLTSSVEAGLSCRAEIRICNDGALSGSFAYSSCQVSPSLRAPASTPTPTPAPTPTPTPTPAPASCNFAGSTVAHGSTVLAYASSSVAFGSVCSSERRVCSNGALSGNFAHSTCKVQEPLTCRFAGNSVAHGSTVLAYASSSVAFGGVCNGERRVCNNGTLSGSFTHSTCNVQGPATCNFLGKTLAHGEKVVAYANSRVPYGQQCRQETRVCSNGTLSGSLGHSICNVDAPADCAFVSGIRVPHGGTVVAYKTVQAVRGYCEVERRTCSNGSLSGSYGHSFCR